MERTRKQTTHEQMAMQHSRKKDDNDDGDDEFVLFILISDMPIRRNEVTKKFSR